MGYQCLICYERCRCPVSCTRCKKLMCKSHVCRLEEKCPNCRLEPFAFSEQKYIGQLIDLEIYIEREEMKKSKVFKCLVEGCSFESKFHGMVKHKKKFHYNEKLDEILFPEEREKKLKRQTLRNLLATRLTKIPNKNLQLAFFLYGKTQGNCSLPALAKLVHHLNVCTHPLCKKVILTDNSAYIGDNNVQTPCPQAKPLLTFF